MIGEQQISGPLVKIVFSGRKCGYQQFKELLTHQYLHPGTLIDNIESIVKPEESLVAEQIKSILLLEPNINILNKTNRSLLWKKLYDNQSFYDMENIFNTKNIRHLCSFTFSINDDNIKSLSDDKLQLLLNLLKICDSSPTPFRFLDVISYYLAKPVTQIENKFIKLCCPVVKKGFLGFKKAYLCALLTVHGQFILYSHRLNSNVFVIEYAACTSGGNSGKQVTISSLLDPNISVDFSVQNNSIAKLWSSCFTMNDGLIRSIQLMGTECYHPIFYSELSLEITSHELFIVRSILDVKILSIQNSLQVLDALFVIFASQKCVDRLLHYLCYSEMKFLSNENEILRCNSYLSQLLKVFQERFYGGYSDVFVKPLLELIRNESPLHIKDPEKFDAQKVRELIHVFVRCVVYSRSTIPPQLCHIAYYLKSSVISSFNTKGSVVHSLAALYGLRFIVPLLISSECDEALKENLLHFVQIIQMLLGLNEINLSKNNHLESLEEIIEESVPVISDFLLSLADIDPGVVKYPKFSDEEVDKAVKTVISAVLPKFDAFHQKYMELYQNEKEKRFINSWVIEHNLLNFFKQNPD